MRASTSLGVSRLVVMAPTMLAVTTPNAAIPVTMSTAAIRRPSTVTGAMSPYPTVVTVVTAHQARRRNC